MAEQPLTLSVVLNWSDPAAFAAFAKAFEDPASPTYRQYLRADEVMMRFAPTQQSYNTVLTYLQQTGLTVVAGSANRLTVTARGTRSQIEHAFNLSIDDYQLGNRTFYANDTNPALPATVAPLIRSVSGLSNLAKPRPAIGPSPATPMSIATAYTSPALPPNINGVGQIVGLLEWDNFNSSDVSNWLNAVGLPANMINQVNRVDVNGGTAPSNGPGTQEVLLDIEAVLGIAPGASIIVFDAPTNDDIWPFNDGTSLVQMLTSAIALMNQLTGGFGGVLSASWSSCEPEISDADADAIESLLQAASWSALSFFAASGDYGSSCVAVNSDGTIANLWPNRVTLPAAAPHAVAVGGTTLQVGPNNSYQSESWWTNGQDGTNKNGSYGISLHFPRPHYQDSFTSASGRSVPDVSAEAAPGIVICTPCNQVEGGTSLSAPLWAGIWALVNQARTGPESANGGLLYNWSVFHPASGMTGPGNDFAHLGLGSPDMAKLISNLAGRPEITGLSLWEGPVTGGTTVKISGRNFLAVETVTFDGVAVPFTVNSDQSITVATPSRTFSSSTYVYVKTPAGWSASSQSAVFTFGPVVNGVIPNHGATYGGDRVTITGAGFVSANGDVATFRFGTVPVSAQSVTCSSTQCVMNSPASLNQAVGTVDVTALLYATSAISPSDQFTYEKVCPSVKSISPLIGRDIGGSVVYVYGNGLDPSSGNLAVHFGNNLGMNLYCGDPYSCSVVTPPGTGTVPVTVTKNGCPTVPNPAILFTYRPTPTITSISPGHGSQQGNTIVIVVGGNFDIAPGATTFNFGLMQGNSAQCQSTTKCTVHSPFYVGADQNYVNPVDVVAIVDGVLNSAPTPADRFTYDGLIKPPPCTGTVCQ
jgi:kumamolisin